MKTCAKEKLMGVYVFGYAHNISYGEYVWSYILSRYTKKFIKLNINSCFFFYYLK